MKTQHTPGPWKLSAMTMLSSKSKRVVTTDNKFVLRLEGADFGRDEDCANARLIAAAPDLLAALRNMLGEIRMSGDTENRLARLTIEHAEKAMAKAEGRAG